MVPTRRTTGRSRTHGAQSGAKPATFDSSAVKILAASGRCPVIPPALSPLARYLLLITTTETPQPASAGTMKPSWTWVVSPAKFARLAAEIATARQTCRPIWTPPPFVQQMEANTYAHSSALPPPSVARRAVETLAGQMVLVCAHTIKTLTLTS